MHTFPEATTGPCLNAAAPSDSQPLMIIARAVLRTVWLAISAVLLSQLLSGCSTVRLVYGQAPNLTYWWIDGFVDLSDGQSVQLRKDIDRFFDWHRSTELPQYAAHLGHWQDLARKDSTTELACSQFRTLQQAYVRAVDRSVEPMARLAVSLGPDQWQHLQRHQAKSNQRFADDWLGVTPAQRQERLFDRAADRYKTLYGKLTPTQTAWLGQRMAQSRFDPQRVQTERLRRQTDLLATLKSAQADPTNAASALRAWHARVMHSPTPGFAAYSEQLIQEGCAQFAGLHNLTSPEQRAHAVGVLQSYEADLQALLPQP